MRGTFKKLNKKYMYFSCESQIFFIVVSERIVTRRILEPTFVVVFYYQMNKAWYHVKHTVNTMCQYL